MFRKKKPEMYIPPELQAYYAPEIKAKKRLNKKRLAIAGVALIAVIALGVGIGLLLSDQSNDQFGDTNQPASQSSEQAPRTERATPVPNNSAPSSEAVPQPF